MKCHPFSNTINMLSCNQRWREVKSDGGKRGGRGGGGRGTWYGGRRNRCPNTRRGNYQVKREQKYIKETLATISSKVRAARNPSRCFIRGAITTSGSWIWFFLWNVFLFFVTYLFSFYYFFLVNLSFPFFNFYFLVLYLLFFSPFSYIVHFLANLSYLYFLFKYLFFLYKPSLSTLVPFFFLISSFNNFHFPIFYKC